MKTWVMLVLALSCIGIALGAGAVFLLYGNEIKSAPCVVVDRFYRDGVLIHTTERVGKLRVTDTGIVCEVQTWVGKTTPITGK